jgi:hypothetical protein
MSFEVRLVSQLGGYLVLGACIFSCAHGSTLADDGAGGDGGAGSTTGAQNGTTTTAKGVTNATGNGVTNVTVTHASSTTNVQPNSVTVQQAATTGTQMGACDTGQFGSLLANATPAQQTICTDCVTCSQSDQCANEWNTFAADPDEPAYGDCITQCGSDTTCISQCASFYPSADSEYNTAVACSICMECTMNCDAADTCM